MYLLNVLLSGFLTLLLCLPWFCGPDYLQKLCQKGWPRSLKGLGLHPTLIWESLSWHIPADCDCWAHRALGLLL